MFDGPLLHGRWRLGPRMGSGAQARTYVARDEKAKDGPLVIVKQLELNKDSASWKSFDLFEREVRVLRTLRHPGIPQFFDFFESSPGVLNLVMQKMPGATLRAIATKARFADGELRDVLVRVLTILDYLHTHDPPVIHRDIKPANLLRDAKGNVSLVDFGGVRDAMRQEGGSTVIGTFGYMAPEQLHGQATPATDLYALGATIVALARGVEPEHVPRKGLRMDLKAHLRGIDPALVQVLEAMTEPDPDQRPQSAREVLAELAQPSQRAAALIAPVGDIHKAASGSSAQGAPRHPFDEVNELLAGVPQPFAFALRLALLVFALGGYVGMAVLQTVLMPIVFALVGTIAGERARPKIAGTRSEILGALEEGKQGFRHLAQRCMPAAKAKPRLGKTKEPRRLDK